MVRRALLITVALCVVCVMASGAWAGSERFLNLVVPTIDTSSLTGDTVNYTYTWSANSAITTAPREDFSRILVKVYRTEVDTTIAGDSVSFTLQTKMDSPYDSTWHTIATTGLIADLGWTSATAFNKRFNVVMSDSGGAVFPVFRIQTTVNMAIDTAVVNARLSSNADSTHIPWNGAYVAHFLFREE